MDAKANKLVATGIDRRDFVLGASALVAAMALGGCSNDKPADTANVQVASHQGGTLKYAIKNPVSIDPYNCYEVAGMQVCNALFDALLAYDDKAGSLVGLAASTWEMNEAATVFTFHLVKGATFHNGERVTAADFKYAWERIVDPAIHPADPSHIVYLLSNIEGYDDLRNGTEQELLGVVALGDHTLEVTLATPDKDFAYTVAHPALAPVPSSAANLNAFKSAPVGNGPYRMDGSWVDGQYIKTIRFDEYYGEPALMDGIDFMILKDEETSYLEFRAGNLDFSAVSADAITDALKIYTASEDGLTLDPQATFLLGEEYATFYLIVNCAADSFLGNPLVRRALSLAIDREAICKEVFLETCDPATGIVPPGIEGYREDAWEFSRYDVQAAKECLKLAGYPGGQGAPNIKLSFSKDAGNPGVMDIVQTCLRAIGLGVDLEQSEWTTYAGNLRGDRFQIACISWTADAPTLYNFLHPLFSSASNDNYSNYSNQSFDEGIAAARQITDDLARTAAMQALDAQVCADMPVIPLFFKHHHHVGSSNVNNLYYDRLCLAHLKDCWFS